MIGCIGDQPGKVCKDIGDGCAAHCPWRRRNSISISNSKSPVESDCRRGIVSIDGTVQCRDRGIYTGCGLCHHRRCNGRGRECQVAAICGPGGADTVDPEMVQGIGKQSRYRTVNSSNRVPAYIQWISRDIYPVGHCEAIIKGCDGS